jgi:23S rRNA (uracil1939-C5)-methyltransferase
MEKLLRPGEGAQLHVTQLRAGLDVSLDWKKPRKPDVLFALAEFARDLQLARLSWNGEPVAVARAPYLKIGDHTVLLPVEPFLQPTAEGEAILQSLVREGVEGAGHIADLFAGCGTFALSLDETCSVVAVESNAAMMEALGNAANEKSSKVAVEIRDLFRRPLLAAELHRFDAVILDPPRPGAKRQAEQLARADVRKIVYVSCNPSSFARDARIICDGGYVLQRVVPVDQFLWSAHVELVAFFDRNANR